LGDGLEDCRGLTVVESLVLGWCGEGGVVGDLAMEAVLV
jgi:hypothetical protein